MQKTFYHFLPEAGRPLLMKADEISQLNARIDALKKELKEAGDTLTRLSAELWRETTSNWSAHEIECAHQLLTEHKKEGAK